MLNYFVHDGLDSMKHTVVILNGRISEINQTEQNNTHRLTPLFFM